MSFNISFGVNNSPTNKINKDITISQTVSGTLKAGTSVIDPVILIAGDAGAYSAYNYMQIDTFNGRKYFITDIRTQANGILEISGHVDVLYTYATQILAQSAVIARQENNWNLYIEDGIFKTYANSKIITKTFPSGFDSQSFVLAVAGGTE